jgi:hypothetical protein
MKVTTFRELMNGHATAEIRCLYTGNLVRKLSLTTGAVSGTVYVEIDPVVGPRCRVPDVTPITYTPWVLDRGNMNFPGDATGVPEYADKTLKICGEGDPITYGDGTAATVNP